MTASPECSPSRQLVLKKLHDCFPAKATADQVLSILDSYPSDSGKGRDRVHLAILMQCQGSPKRVQELVGLAHRDFRDVLVDAEYPEQVQASDRTPPEQMEAIRKRDREQYEQWLKSDAGAI